MINSMKKQDCGYILLQGIFLVSVIFFTLLVSTILFVFHVSVSSANLLLAFLCSAVVIFYFSEKSIKQTLITSIVGVLFVFGFSLICSHIYDWSWDGNTYHKSITGFLKYGWNPLYETFYDFAANNFPFITYSATWCDAYPKGTEIWGACVYSLFNNIEAGKSFNIIAAFALFFICYAFLKETRLLKKWQILCCSILLVVNPVTVGQAVTYYTDGFLYQMLLLCFVSILYLTFYNNHQYTVLAWYLIYVSINIGFNIKFSSTIFFAILCLSFFFYWIYQRTKVYGFNKSTLYYFKNSFCFFAVSVLSGTLLTGCTSYVINIIRHGNPFYTMIGEGSTEMITSLLPVAFKELSNPARFVCSLFSKSNGGTLFEHLELKMPLTFNSDEFRAMLRYDVRTAGWGILFSGILLISVVVIIFFKQKKINKQMKELTVLLSGVFVLSVFVVPGLSWARYCLVIFWIPVAALIYIFLYKNRFSQTLFFVAGILVSFLYVNIMPNLVQNYSLVKEYDNTKQELEKFKVVTEYNNITIHQERDFYGRYFNLYDIGITKMNYGDVQPKECTGSLFNQYHLYYNITNGIMSTDNLTDFLSYYDENKILLIAVKDEASKALTTDIVQKMQSLGLKFELPNHYRWSYLAVLYGNKVIYENLADEQISYNDKIGNINVSMLSAGYETGSAASIMIDGEEFAFNERGLNIVMYDKINDNVIDSVCVDTYADNKLTRMLP